MSAGVSWLDAFPQGDAAVVVDTLCHVWRQLASLSKLTFNSAATEPQLTELLCEQIRAVFKERTKLTGQWSYERRMGVIDNANPAALKVKQRKRTDIEYFSDRTEPPLQLVFEFKKISHTLTRRRAYTGEEGLERFVTGSYSAGQPVAVMVGIMSEAASACLPPLAAYLQEDGCRKALRMKAAPEQCIQQPSIVFPTSAQFDTEHSRDAHLAPAHGKITICHVFVGFP